MSYTVILVIIAVVVLFIIAAVLGDKEGKRAGKKAEKRLRKIDETYQEFIEKSINLDIIKNDSIELDAEKLLNDVLTVLKPDIDGLISHINATTYSSAETSYESVYFSGAVSLTNSFYKKSRENPGHVLTSHDEKEYFEVFKDAIKADIKKRMLNLETGNI